MVVKEEYGGYVDVCLESDCWRQERRCKGFGNAWFECWQVCCCDVCVDITHSQRGLHLKPVAIMNTVCRSCAFCY